MLKPNFCCNGGGACDCILVGVEESVFIIEGEFGLSGEGFAEPLRQSIPGGRLPW